MCSLAREITRGEEIQRRLVALEMRDNVRMVERLGLIAELDGLGSAQKGGFRSTAHWFSVECRVDSRTARDYVRVAKRLEHWLQVRDALGEGRISYSQCRAITRASVDEDQA